MSGPTIQDIILRVHVDGSALKIPPIDTSAFRHSLDDVKKLLTTMVRQDAANALQAAIDRDQQRKSDAAVLVKQRNQQAAAESTKRRENLVSGAKDLANVAANAFPEIEPVVKGAIQVQEAYQALSTLAAGMGTTLSLPFTGAAVAITGLAIATKTAYSELDQLNKMYAQSMLNERQQALSRVTDQAVRRNDQAVNLAMATPYTGEVSEYLASEKRREAREADIRKVESSNLSPNQKAQYRERQESMGQLEDLQKAAESKIKFKQDQLDEVKAARIQLEQQRKNVEASGSHLVGAAKQGVEQSTQETKLGAMTRAGYVLAAGPGLRSIVNIGVDQRTGLYNSQMNAKDAAQKDVAAANVLKQQELERVNNALIQNRNREIALKGEINQQQMIRHSAATKMLDISTQVVPQEQSRVVQGAAAVGQVAHERGAVPQQQTPPQNVPRQARAFRQTWPQHPDVDHRLMQRRPNNSGGIADVPQRHPEKSEEKEPEPKLDSELIEKEQRRQEDLKSVIADARKNLEQGETDIKAAAQEMAAAIKARDKTSELVAAFTEALRHLDSQNKEMQQLRQFYFGF